MNGEKNEPQKTAQLNLPFNFGKESLPINNFETHKRHEKGESKSTRV